MVRRILISIVLIFLVLGCASKQFPDPEYYTKGRNVSEGHKPAYGNAKGIQFAIRDKLTPTWVLGTNVSLIIRSSYLHARRMGAVITA